MLVITVQNPIGVKVGDISVYVRIAEAESTAA
jgi:hypothetical protein